MKKAVLKNFAIFTGNNCWSLLLIKLPAFSRKSILKNASELTLGSDWLELCFWTVAFKTILTQYCCYKNITRFQTRQSFKHISARMPSLYLTPTLYFDLGLSNVFTING